jgi:cyclopropane-fatty-acyl-phospholipid synthase
LQDYRQLSETYDHVVSNEMLEAVGGENWETYAGTLTRCLDPGGRAALQFITIDESVFDTYRRNAVFIQRYIFPGGMLPTLTRFHAFTADSGLRTVRADLFGEHCARTLSEWHRRFVNSEHEVEQAGYGERFRRMWRYYLSYCEAGFRSDRIDPAQVLLANQ